MTKPYAEGTTVPVQKSRTELDTLLEKHGATQRGVMVDDVNTRALIFFALAGRHYKIVVPLPKATDVVPGDGEEPRGWSAWSTQKRQEWVSKAYDQRVRERWRAVVLMVKAKLEVVQIGLSTVEREFFADLVLPDGKRLHEALTKQLDESYKTGAAPPLLLGMGGSGG